MKSTEAPVMNISEKHIDVWIAGNITLFARTSENNLYYLFRVYTVIYNDYHSALVYATQRRRD